jgi:cell division protein FtsB
VIRRLLFPALLGLAAYYAIFGGEYSVLDVKRIHAETEAARSALAHLKTDAALLSSRADALESDPRTLEALARERFGLIYDGEVLYRFADAPEED